MISRLRVLALALAVAMATPAHVRAQQNAAVSGAGPTLESTVTAVRARVHSAENAMTSAVQRRSGTDKPVALMIVGGAAILIGAVIGDAAGTLFMIGGAVAFLYGLYLYLQ
jgi:hypothetical protein